MKNEREKQGNTLLLYETDSYIKEFECVVLSCIKDEDSKKYKVILDKTAFFPEGGGQTCDTGYIGDGKVSNVQTINGEVIHFTDIPLKEGESVKCSIDWDVRFRKMQNHSGEHLLCSIINNKFGYDNVGFHMNENEVTFDVNGALSEEDMVNIEREANMAIYENVPITVSFPNEEEAKLLDYRSKLELTEGIRLVTIEGYDVCACCAPHVSHTGEIGVIKVINIMPHRGGTRITMLAGYAAYDDYVKLARNNDAIVRMVSSKRYDTGTMTEAFLNRYQKMQEELNAYKREISKMISDSCIEKILAREALDNSPEVIFSESLDNVQLRNIINECKKRFDIRIAGFIGNDTAGYDYIIAGGDELQSLAKEINMTFSGRGGGTPQMIQGHVNGNREEIEKFLKNNHKL